MRNRDGAARRFVPSPRGRPTRGQARALALLSPRYEIPPPTADGDARQTANGNGADWPRIFGRRAPLCVEIGSGDGEVIAQRALAMPQADFVAIEIYRPGLGRLFTRLRDLGIDNVKAAPMDADAAMRQFFAAGALAEIAIFFPDPWPKTRQQKRRLIDESFACLAARKIAVGGLFRLATDDAGYARAMRQAAAAARDENGGGFSPIAAPARPPTKYERRARESARPVFDLAFVKTR